MYRVNLSLQRIGAVLCVMIGAPLALTASPIGKRMSRSAKPQNAEVNDGACEAHAPAKLAAPDFGDRRVPARDGGAPRAHPAVEIDATFPAIFQSLILCPAM